MKKQLSFKKTLLSSLIATAFVPAVGMADQLNFSTLPPGLISIKPTPNVIVTIDDSGSMSEKVGGGDNKTKMFRLKEALNDVFSDATLLPNGKIRLAWQVMHNNGKSPSAGNLTAGAVNSMKKLDATHRANFISFANSLTPNSGTPSHKMMYQAYNYMKVGKSINSPWASDPGKKAEPYLGCRRSYHIFLTDGGWNGYAASELPREIDNSNFTLPDGTAYSTTSNQTNVYRGATKDLLADWAMKGWAEDLQTDIPNDLKPSTTDGVPSTETYGSVLLQRYWNPKHNPATWQHLVNYTIGYGVSAYTWPSAPVWSSADDDNYGAGGDFSKLVTGAVKWVPTTMANLNANNPAELWHMAINSRGKFYPTGPGRQYSLKSAFTSILQDIELQNTADITSMTGSATSIARSSLKSFSAGYEPKRWSGYVKSYLINTSGAASADPDWGTTGPGSQATTADKLDARASIADRLILTTNDATNKGVSFEWETGTTKLSAAQKALLNADSKGQDRVNFLRGDRTNEGETASKPFRIRDSRHGDVINSGVWYIDAPVSNYSFPGYGAFASSQANRLPMIYVGANDGMLHGFSAVNGEEKIAFIPKAVIPELKNLSAANYKHQYFVDGSPFSGDVDLADKSAPGYTSNWKTMLFGSLGAGGKGYFILDITSPGTKSAPSSGQFAKVNAESLVVLDKTIHPSTAIATGSIDEDIGHIFQAPVLDDTNTFKASQFSLMNDGRWAVIFGNGYNSKNEQPVLLIQYLDGAKELKKIVATGTLKATTPTSVDVIGNGLSAPKPVDINSDGMVDVVYAGDLKGNLWKFDLSSTSASNWKVANWGTASLCDWQTAVCYPLFTAKDAAGNRQPISAPPTVKANDRGAGGMMVAFGTGVNLTDDDRSSSAVQSMYAIQDNTRYKIVSGRVSIDSSVTPKAVLSDKSELVAQTVIEAHAGAGVSTGSGFFKLSDNDVNYDEAKGTVKRGWYFDFPKSGERVLKQIFFYDGSNILAIASTQPAYGGNGSSTEESCEPAGTPEKTYLTLMNIMDGKRPSVQVMDQNGDGLYNADDNLTSRIIFDAPGPRMGITSKEKIKFQCADPASASCNPPELARLPTQNLRPSWRQIQ